MEISINGQPIVRQRVAAIVAGRRRPSHSQQKREKLQIGRVLILSFFFLLFNGAPASRRVIADKKKIA